MNFNRSVRVVDVETNETICDLACQVAIVIMARSSPTDTLDKNVRTLHPDDLVTIHNAVETTADRTTKVRFTQDFPMPAS